MGRGILTEKLRKCMQKEQNVSMKLVVVKLIVLNGGSIT